MGMQYGMVSQHTYLGHVSGHGSKGLPPYLAKPPRTTATDDGRAIRLPRTLNPHSVPHIGRYIPQHVSPWHNSTKHSRSWKGWDSSMRRKSTWNSHPRFNICEIALILEQLQHLHLIPHLLEQHVSTTLQEKSCQAAHTQNHHELAQRPTHRHHTRHPCWMTQTFTTRTRMLLTHNPSVRDFGYWKRRRSNHTGNCKIKGLHRARKHYKYIPRPRARIIGFLVVVLRPTIALATAISKAGL